MATPIGNARDITLRALSVLMRADRVICEDTRHSLKLFNHFGVARRLAAYHEHNAHRERPKILRWLAEGASVALISDAGTPLISDPGYKLVREAAEAGHQVFAIPGPSSLIAALSVSGLPTDSFFFAGFLPPRDVAMRRRLAELYNIAGTLVFFETAPRLAATLNALGEVFPGREAVIARELTKCFEEVVRGSLPLTEAVRDVAWRGEFVVLVSPPVENDVEEGEIEQALEEALKSMSVRDAVEKVARTFGVRKKMVYNLALCVGGRQPKGEEG
ncbi:MAG: 16S rRNA (cytidine(1402)-2'-O)-methyltransferase [Alphaproteobacteria bacterium]